MPGTLCFGYLGRLDIAVAGLMISQTSCSDIFQEGGLVYMVIYTNLTGQVVKLVRQMAKLTGKCPVTDC